MMHRIATVFGIGRMRPAPGTWGSATAIVAGVAIDRLFTVWGLLAAFVIVTALGFRACAATCGPGEDPSEVVIDEVAGQWLALLFPAFAFWNRGMDNWALDAWPGWVAAFLFFRLFDIWKPGPVGRADRRGDATGVMLDDLWAGLFAGLMVVVMAGLWHGVMGM
ncbi:phosphatidylglycerophosphatase A [Rhodobacter sp. Har01]|uniref:phosphatidylglycerophosphatase A family protein n=1 Tax=Rhodobacter sp. Har01 TaxID=2883999 RepID=UPI001D07FD44|nr:phosphatidylglycerophosphatase A [Rhodobacter sp. Har01]MCB6177104.1 phosphatidylglycerophosphatase A [Rhodobacter sp. Har01]